MKELWYQLRWALPLRLVGLLTAWFPDNRVAMRLRGWCMGFFIGECGSGFMCGRHVTLLNSHRLRIGKNVYIACGGWYNALGGLEIEDEVVLGPYVVISTLQHVFRNRSVRFGGSIMKPVRIGKGTWVAAHATLKCGVTVGEGSLVAAQAAVTKDVPPGVIAGGVPARVLGRNEDREATLHVRN